MTSPTVYFVTGANRGIGLALVQALIKNPDVYVFAAARNNAPVLKELIDNHPDKAAFVSFVAADEHSNKEAAKAVKDKFGASMSSLGLQVCISNYLGSAEETPAAALDEHFKVNVTGMLVLYQAFAPLLRKSSNAKFIPFSSGAGSISGYIDMVAGYTCYGVSKVALNYLSRKIHFENQWLSEFLFIYADFGNSTINVFETCFPFAPENVNIPAALNRALDKTGTLAPVQDAISPEVAAISLMGVIESSTRETHGGEFVNIDGSKIPW